MKLAELMQERPPSLSPDHSWLVAAELALWTGARALPIVARGRLVGLVTERDLVAALERGEGGGRVGSSPRPMPLVAGPDDDAREAVARLVAEAKELLVVAEEGFVVGIVSLADALALLARETRPRPPAPRRVRDVMIADVPVCALDDPLAQALATMRRKAARWLVAVDPERHVVGLLSDRDLRRALADLIVAGDERDLPARLRPMKVWDLARRSPRCLRFDASLADAVELLVSHRVEAAPVLDAEERLCGLLTSLDLLAAGAGPA